MHLPNDGLNEDKTDSTQIRLIFRNMFSERADGTFIATQNTFYTRNEHKIADKPD